VCSAIVSYLGAILREECGNGSNVLIMLMCKLMVRNGFILLLVVLGGCSDSHLFAQKLTNLVGRNSPVDSFSIERKRRFVLPMESVLYVMRPSGRVIGKNLAEESSVKHAQGVAESTTAQRLSLFFAKVQMSRQLETVTEGLKNASKTSANFMVLPRIIQWPSAKPVYYQHCHAGESELCKDTTTLELDNVLSKDVEMLITFSIFDVATGALIDHIGVTMNSGVTSYVYTNYDKDLSNLVEKVVAKLVNS